MMTRLGKTLIGTTMVVALLLALGLLALANQTGTMYAAENTPEQTEMRTMRGPGQGQGPRREQAPGQEPGFVDVDGDGVCDNMGTRPNRGQGPGFVDADGDGVCDNAGSGPRGQQNRRNMP